MLFSHCNSKSEKRAPIVAAGAANGANGANNNVKAAVIPPASPAVTPNSSSASSVKTVALPATPVMKVIHLHAQLRDVSIYLLTSPFVLFPSENCSLLHPSVCLLVWRHLFLNLSLSVFPPQTALVGLVDYPDDEDEEEEDDEEEQSPRKRPRLSS